MKPLKPIAFSKNTPRAKSLPPEPSPLAELQRLMARAVMRPLTGSDRMQPRWEDGRRTGEIAGGFIKPNDRLTAFDRLEIYNRQYWFRLLDCLHDDFPGLRAVLGGARFQRLATAYLVTYPSTSPTLRDLGSRLVRFLLDEPEWTAPHTAVALDMARLEWAQIVAFDSARHRPATLRSLGALPPEKIFLRLQPFITLLDLAYPVDKTVLRLLRQDDRLRSETSNASESSSQASQRSIAHRIKPAPTRLLVHRQNNAVYFKPLIEAQYVLFEALSGGASLTTALEKIPTAVTSQDIQEWFRTWAGLGFFRTTPAGRATAGATGAAFGEFITPEAFSASSDGGKAE